VTLESLMVFLVDLFLSFLELYSHIQRSSQTASISDIMDFQGKHFLSGAFL